MTVTYKLLVSCLTAVGVGSIAYPLSKVGKTVEEKGTWKNYDEAFQTLDYSFSSKWQAEGNRSNLQDHKNCSAWVGPWKYKKSALLIKCDESHYYLYYDVLTVSHNSDEVTKRAKEIIIAGDSTAEQKLEKHYQNGFLKILGL